MDRSSIARWGFWQVVVASAYRRIKRLCGIHVYLVNSRPLARLEQTELASGHEVRRVIPEDTQSIIQVPELGLDEVFLKQAFERGDVCIGYFVEGQLVSYFWCGFNQVPAEAGLVAEMGDGYSYAYKAQTLKDFRGQRLQEVLTHHNDHLLLENGLEQNIEYIDFANLPQRSASARYGNRTVGYITRIKFRDIDRLYHSNGAQRANFRFVFQPVV
ncbi:MAG: hypothetical protein AAF541_23640 [Pseudomonadota bacterium]